MSIETNTAPILEKSLHRTFRVYKRGGLMPSMDYTFGMYIVDYEAICALITINRNLKSARCTSFYAYFCDQIFEILVRIPFSNYRDCIRTPKGCEIAVRELAIRANRYFGVSK